MSAPKFTGGPAFPVSSPMDASHGMTLLDYFAGQAIVGAMSGAPIDDKECTPQSCARFAYSVAASMLALRNAIHNAPETPQTHENHSNN